VSYSYGAGDLQDGLLKCDKFRTADGCPRVLSGLHRGVRTSLFWDVTQDNLSVPSLRVKQSSWTVL